MVSIDLWTEQTADRRLLLDCKQAIRRVSPDADLILYGSRARGDAQPDSDYDLLVLVDHPVNMSLEESILDQIYPLEVDSCQVLTFAVYNRDQWNSALYQSMPFRRNVVRDGVLV